MAQPEACDDQLPRAQVLLRDCALPPQEARALLAHALGVSREHLITHPEYPVDKFAGSSFARLVRARARGVPMAYLLGVQEFYGRLMRVTPAVLIPRPETELLVQTALRLLHSRQGASVLELGTGSGCIAIAMALERPDLRIIASDRSTAALRIAKQNCIRLGAKLQLLAGNWYAPLRGRFDLIVSNPPYIRVTDEHLPQLGFEPRTALTDESDGLSALRTIITGAAEHLSRGGHLLVEHGYDQATEVRELMLRHGLASVCTLQDLAGHERVCLGQSRE
ncbi:MAG TPA: peptide chain release factor N(5)-glutamine methyltransferase [Burkholderiaceae bacterium]|nr:peptide chain release factor N(5)-glutamine methyltransferase [Burkholderiaceae bacterium]